MRKSLGLLLLFALLGPSLLWSPAQAVAPADFGLREGDLISASGSSDPDVYIVNEWGYKRLFVNPQIFNLYGHLGWNKIKGVPTATRDSFITSGLFRNCESGDEKVYGIEVVSEDIANLRWVNTSGAQAAADDPNFFKKVFCINNAEVRLYGSGTQYSSVLEVPSYSRGGQASAAPARPLTTEQVASTVRRSVVFIQTGAGSGSGFIIDSSGYILTNAHVVSGYSTATVKVDDQRQFSGQVVGYDDEVDLALIKISASGLIPVVMGRSDRNSLRQGESVYALGFPLGFSQDVAFTEGLVSARSLEHGIDYIRMTADILHGNSGGPLVNQSGQVVGINQGAYIDTIGSLKQAIPSDTATYYIPLLKQGRHVGSTPPPTQSGGGGGGGGGGGSHTPTPTPGPVNAELKLAEKSDNPDAQVVDVDDSSSTDSVVLLSATLKATGSDIYVKEMTVSITPTGSGDASEQASQYTLEIDGDAIQSVSSNACTVPGDCDGSGTNTAVSYVFDDVDLSINEDDTVTVRLLADINEGDTANFANGDTLAADIDNDETEAEDQNSDLLSAAKLTGVVNGNAQAFYTEGIKVVFDSATKSVTANDTPTADVGNYTIKLKVTAFDTDAYVHNNCVEGTGPTNGEGIAYVLDGTNGGSACTFTNSDETLNGNFQVSEGETHTFTLTLAVTGADDFVKVALESINWDDADDAAGSMNQFYTFNLDEFETGSQYLGL